jgi:formylglycine-generating enzyme required for sulfatase activity
VYAEGMTVPADVLLRAGYRLPTEAEWEYACRSGAMTGRYYGASTELLGLYARYQANSRGHAWACGGLLPNDLGLFDMLGNLYEWVHDRDGIKRKSRHGIINDNITTIELVNPKIPRLLRGGMYNNQPAFVRSAYRNWIAPSYRLANGGFRLARTYP